MAQGQGQRGYDRGWEARMGEIGGSGREKMKISVF